MTLVAKVATVNLKKVRKRRNQKRKRAPMVVALLPPQVEHIPEENKQIHRRFPSLSCFPTEISPKARSYDIRCQQASMNVLLSIDLRVRRNVPWIACI